MFYNYNFIHRAVKLLMTQGTDSSIKELSRKKSNINPKNQLVLSTVSPQLMEFAHKLSARSPGAPGRNDIIMDYSTRHAYGVRDDVTGRQPLTCGV